MRRGFAVASGEGDDRDARGRSHQVRSRSQRSRRHKRQRHETGGPAVPPTAAAQSKIISHFHPPDLFCVTQRPLCANFPPSKKKQAVVHVSTCYIHLDKPELDEVIYAPPIEPQQLIDAVESMNSAQLHDLIDR